MSLGTPENSAIQKLSIIIIIVEILGLVSTVGEILGLAPLHSLIRVCIASYFLQHSHHKFFAHKPEQELGSIRFSIFGAPE